MGKKFLIDTNTLIDAQTRKLPESGLQFLERIIDEDFSISFVTYIICLDGASDARFQLCPVQSNPDKCTKCVSIVRAHATAQRDYAVLRSEFLCRRVLKQLICILCIYPGSTVSYAPSPYGAAIILQSTTSGDFRNPQCEKCLRN